MVKVVHWNQSDNLCSLSRDTTVYTTIRALLQTILLLCPSRTHIQHATYTLSLCHFFVCVRTSTQNCFNLTAEYNFNLDVFNGWLSCGSPHLVALGIFGALTKLKSAANDLPYTCQVVLGQSGQCNAQASKVTNYHKVGHGHQVHNSKEKQCAGVKLTSWRF